MTELVLTPPELSFCVSLASQRIASKGKWNRFHLANLTPFGSHLVGVMGEFGVCKVHKGKINQEVLPHGDRKCDVITNDGRKVEVKASTWTTPDVELKLHDYELVNGIWIVLVQIFLPDKMNVFPMVSSETFRKLSETKNYGYGNRFIMTAKQLLTIHERRNQTQDVHPGPLGPTPGRSLVRGYEARNHDPGPGQRAAEPDPESQCLMPGF